MKNVIFGNGQRVDILELDECNIQTVLFERFESLWNLGYKIKNFIFFPQEDNKSLFKQYKILIFSECK